MYRTTHKLVTLGAALSAVILPACRTPQAERLPEIPAAASPAPGEKQVVQRVSYDAEQPAQPPEPQPAKPDSATPPAPATAPPPEQPPQPLETVLPARLTLAELESLALQRNPTLTRADARINAARGEWLQVGLRPNPRVGYDGGEIGNEGRSGMQGAFVSQEFVTADKLLLSQTVMNREIERLQQESAAQQQRVLTDVRRAFYDVLAAQSSMDLARDLSQIGQKAYDTSQNLFKSGNVSEVDVLQARIESEQAKIMLENARNRHSTAWHQLAVVVGEPSMPSRPLDGDLRSAVPELGFEKASQRLMAESPELATAYAALAKSQAGLGRAYADRYPNWEAQAGAQYDNATQDTVANVQISVPLPVFNRNQGGIRQAQAQIAAAQADVARMELLLQQRLGKAFEPYRNARVQTEAYGTRILPDAKRSLDIAVKSYEAGEVGFLGLLNVQRTYFQTQVAYLEALRQLRDSAESIEGLLLTDSLQTER
jgi:cobalt-zinc-cadmium efflux system outer membrane protein